MRRATFVIQRALPGKAYDGHTLPAGIRAEVLVNRMYSVYLWKARRWPITCSESSAPAISEAYAEIQRGLRRGTVIGHLKAKHRMRERFRPSQLKPEFFTGAEVLWPAPVLDLATCSA